MKGLNPNIVTNSLDDYADKIRDQHKLGRFGKPEEIAGAAFFLASDDANFITGQVISVSGGLTMNG